MQHNLSPRKDPEAEQKPTSTTSQQYHRGGQSRKPLHIFEYWPIVLGSPGGECLTGQDNGIGINAQHDFAALRFVAAFCTVQVTVVSVSLPEERPSSHTNSGLTLAT